MLDTTLFAQLAAIIISVSCYSSNDIIQVVHYKVGKFSPLLKRWRGFSPLSPPITTPMINSYLHLFADDIALYASGADPVLVQHT